MVTNDIDTATAMRAKTPGDLGQSASARGRLAGLLAAGLAALLACSCALQSRPTPSPERAAAGLPDDLLASDASVPALAFSSAALILDNDDSFEQKLELVRNARQTLDLAYYIFSDDFSSSLLAEELIQAARRGVRVRLLLDYFINYQRLDLFRLLEREGNRGAGSLEVRFFNRPTNTIIADAVYLTLGCGEAAKGADLEGCSEVKLADIDRRLEQSKGPGRGIPGNYNSGGSGLFLSGLYAQQPKVMAYAITEGQNLDLSIFKPASNQPKRSQEERQETLATGIQAAKVYWQARASNQRTFQRTLAEVKLGLAFTLYGDRINPLYHALKAYLPLYRLEAPDPDLRDWDHLTDFLHHKLLLADNGTLILGGRNVEDTYHMHTNPLLQRYRFLDTDLRVDLRHPMPALGRTFERLWDFRVMVATLDDVLAHAPNDFLMATVKADALCGRVEETQDSAAFDDCRVRVFAQHADADYRIAEAEASMRERAERYRRDYHPAPADQRSPLLPVDPQARLYYLENLPLRPSEPGVRSYGAANGREAESGKAIHAVWLAGLRNACAATVPERPQRVVLHTAYFLPPANLLKQMGDMASGALSCSDMELTVLTNSADTTDLGIVNFAARYPIKAVSDRLAEQGEPTRAARVRYFEYLPQGNEEGTSEVSLHSKVSVLGPDLLIGSANADVRSFMMDTNNAVLIGSAPNLRARYVHWLDGLLSDPERTTELTGHMRSTSLEQILAEDRETVQAFLQRKLSPRFAEELPLTPLLDESENILSHIYRLSYQGLGDGKAAARDRERFNALLKLL